MFTLSEILNCPPFSLDKNEKGLLYERALESLSQNHYDNCPQYRKICYFLDEKSPLLPVRLFKEYELLSVPHEDVVKTMTSSGTTGQRVSKIFLDKNTSANQTRVLTKVASDFLGSARLPMLIIDSRSVLKDRTMFSARGAGILGFSMLGRDITYALDENMKLDYETVEAFLAKHSGSDIFCFGFTSMIWEHFYQELRQSGKKIDLKNGILLHGGGWKKLIEQAVTPEQFKKSLNEVCSINQVYNYYGMVEQTGSVYMECEHGRLHASIFSDVFIRRPSDFSICMPGEKGLLQTVSLLPESYPGHNLLTEDIGEIIGEDDCPCGRLGKTFKVHGRVKNAEVRGCSDTYEKR